MFCLRRFSFKNHDNHMKVFVICDKTIKTSSDTMLRVTTVRQNSKVMCNLMDNASRLWLKSALLVCRTYTAYI